MAITLKFDPEDFTLGDFEDFEEYVGTAYDEVMKPKPVTGEDGKRVFDSDGRPVMSVKLPIKAITALAWLTRRKTDPAFSVQDARNLKVADIEITKGAPESQGND